MEETDPASAWPALSGAGFRDDTGQDLAGEGVNLD